jgi:hypothetical protein
MPSEKMRWITAYGVRNVSERPSSILIIQRLTPDFPRMSGLTRCLATASGVLISSSLGQELAHRLRLGCVGDHGG